MPLRLAELIDLEWYLEEDRGRDPGFLRSRDRKIGRELAERAPTGPLDRQGIFGAWIDARRAEDVRAGATASPGQRFQGALALLSFALTAVGLLIGAGMTYGLLSVSDRPVNVAFFLAILIAPQLLLLLLLLLSFAPAGVQRALPFLGWIPSLLHSLGMAASRVAGLVAKLPGLGGAKGMDSEAVEGSRAAAAAFLGRLRARHGIYAGVERWTLVRLTQTFGIGFNVAAIGMLTLLATFSALAFGWATTLESLSPERFHSICGALATPWSAFFPGTVPTLEVVEQSQLFFGNQPSIDPENDRRGVWWGFLAMCLVVYGLAPRVLAWGAAKFLEGGTIRALPLDTADLDRLFERISQPLVEMRSPEAPERVKEVGEATGGRSLDLAVTRERPCTAVLWSDVPMDEGEVTQLAHARFGWKLSAVLRAGGRDLTDDRRTLEHVQGAGEIREPLLVVAESFEAPNKDVRRFLADVRERAGKTRPLVVGIVGKREGGEAATGPFTQPTAADEKVWRHRVDAMGDPYLRVELLVQERSEQA